MAPLALVLVLSGLYVVVINPLDWFLRESEHFSVDRFLAIEPGTELSKVTDVLGEPIATKELTPDQGCDNCSVHYFLGEPPGWLVGHREAWVVVDEKGRVVQRILNDEP
jgi:hypothetical protein